MPGALSAGPLPSQAAAGGLRPVLTGTLYALAPIVLALVCGGIILLAVGVSPFHFYANVLRTGLSDQNLARSLTLMAPLLVLAIGLIVAFRAGIWNLGYDGLYLLGAVLTTGLGSRLGPGWGPAGVILLVLAVSFVAGALWNLLPAWLKIRYGTNEIITTLMMSIVGVGVVNILIRQVFQDPAISTPQTATIAVGHMLPNWGGLSASIPIALAIAVLLGLLLQYTAWGLKIRVLGASRKVARHIGLNIHGWTFLLFVLSSGLISLAGSLDMLSRWGYLRANWNPGYGNQILPFVFLARLNPLGAIPLVAFYAVFSTGGAMAAQQSGLSTSFLHIIVALILIFLTVTEYVAGRASARARYLPDELFGALRQWRLRAAQGGQQ